MFTLGDGNAIVPISDLGRITKLPGVGRRFVVLAQFQREGLKTLYDKRPYQSHMLTNKRLHGQHRHDWIPSDRVCHGCNRSFGEIYGYDGREAVEGLGHILVVPENVKHERFFCWSCGASRDTMLRACGSDFDEYIAEDGQDVFAFIAQIVYEDSLADRPEYAGLACHSTVSVSPKYRNTIDGRLNSFEDRRR